MFHRPVHSFVSTSLALVGLTVATASAGTGTVTWGTSHWDPDTGIGWVEVMWQSDVMLSGFQFVAGQADACEVVGLSPLECDEGWFLNFSPVMVLCVAIGADAAIPASSEAVGLITMEFVAAEGAHITFVDPIFSDPDANAIEVTADDVLIIVDDSCPADVYPAPDGDGVVNVDEILALLGDWGVAGSPYDVTGDGFINVDDILAVLNGWGPCL